MNHNGWSSVKTNHDGVKLSVECSNHNSGVMCKTNQLDKQILEQDVPRSCALYLNTVLRLIITMFQEAGTPQVLNPISHRAYSHHSLRQLLHLGYWSPNSLTPSPPLTTMESTYHPLATKPRYNYPVTTVVRASMCNKETQ